MKFEKTYLHWVLACTVAISILCTACTEDIDLSDYNAEANRLVLYCRLCPQFDTTYIFLAHSHSIFGRQNVDNPNMWDAQVSLSNDGTNWITASYNEDKECYMITQEQMPIIEGKTYYIRAEHPGYNSVRSSCTVPYNRPVNARIYASHSPGNDIHAGEIFSEPHWDFIIEWQDFPNEANYYAIMRDELWTNTGFFDDELIEYGYGISTDIVHFSDDKNYYYVLSDENRDGQSMRFILNYYLDSWQETTPDNIYDLIFNDTDTDIVLRTYLMSLDKNCYLYEKTLHYAGDGLSSFLLEPNHTYSNIENGFGLFGAFNFQKVEIAE